jgi:hypothetical protein
MLRRVGALSSEYTVKHSISSQVSNDIKAARKIWLPWRVLLPLGVLVLGVIVVCDHFGRLNMALPIINCIGVFGLFIYLKWGLRRQPLFWSVIAMLAALHALLIWYLPWTSKWVPAATIAGISSIDFCLILWILAAVETLVRDRATAGK